MNHTWCKKAIAILDFKKIMAFGIRNQVEHTTTTYKGPGGRVGCPTAPSVRMEHRLKCWEEMGYDGTSTISIGHLWHGRAGTAPSQVILTI